MLQTDKGLDVIVEMLADVNLDKDFELAGPTGRIAVSEHAVICCLWYCTVFSVSNNAVYSSFQL